MFDIVSVGSATVDAFAKTEFSELLYDKKKEECIAFPLGTKILINELIFTTGGGGTNTSVSFARLGHKVAFLGKIGTKDNSKRIINELKKEKVDTSLIVRSDKGRTGFSIILDAKNHDRTNHDRTILAFKGSNNDLKFSEINIKKLKAKWFYFSTMVGRSFKTLEQLSEYAQENNIKIALNISPYLAKKGILYLSKILRNTNMLISNMEEANLLTGQHDIHKMLKKLHNSGPSIVTITDGKNPLYSLDGKHIYSAKPPKVKVVETTGAGDAFGSAFLSGIIKKNNIEFAIKLGIVNSQSVLLYHGAKNRLLKFKEALKIIKKKKIRVIEKVVK